MLSSQAAGRSHRADQDPIRLEKIPDGTAFGEKFGVRQNLEIDVVPLVGFEDLSSGSEAVWISVFDKNLCDRRRSADRNSRLFDDDLVRCCMKSNVTGGRFYVAMQPLSIFAIDGHQAHLMSAARPPPMPVILVGVLTAMLNRIQQVIYHGQTENCSQD